ncbi:uncharacterized protein [Penaeus vannamei]|uniref:uncharacterized protein n=1 Tax=Penaeus vannamei TaxID=6689 RepID=UPI00387F84A4
MIERGAVSLKFDEEHRQCIDVCDLSCTITKEKRRKPKPRRGKGKRFRNMPQPPPHPPTPRHHRRPRQAARDHASSTRVTKNRISVDTTTWSTNDPQRTRTCASAGLHHTSFFCHFFLW